MYVSTNDYIFKLISILSEHDLQYQSYFSYYTLYIMFFHVAKIIFKSLKFFTIKSIVIVSTNDSSLEPSFPFFLFTYFNIPLTMKRQTKIQTRMRLNRFFNETESAINRSPSFRKKRFVNILTGDEVKRFRIFVTVNQ